MNNRHETIRQILRDFNNSIPEDINRLNFNKPTKASRSADTVYKACNVLRDEDIVLYTALQTVYLRDGAGDCDLDFYKSRLRYQELCASEQKAVAWLDKHLKNTVLTANFPDSPHMRGKLLKNSDKNRKIAAYFLDLLDHADAETALRETAAAFGVSEKRVNFSLRVSNSS